MGKLTLLFTLIAIFTAPEISRAQFTPWSARQGPSSLREKSDAKYKDAWSLADWFDTQHKMRLMDQWLALNSSSNPFEFFLSGQATKVEQTITKNSVLGLPQKFNMTQGNFGAYVSIIGIESQYTVVADNYTDMEGTLRLRLLGRSQQHTNLTGFYGVRRRVYDEKSFVGQKETFTQNLAGGSLTLNLTKFFGIAGTYKKYFTKKSALDNELGGHRVEGTAFIDVYFVRLYGTWFEEKVQYNGVTTSTQSDVRSRGVLGGLELFF